MLKCLMIRRSDATTLPLHPDLQWTERSSAIEALELARQQPFDALVITGDLDVLATIDWFRLYRTTEASIVPPRSTSLFWVGSHELHQSHAKAIRDLKIQCLTWVSTQDTELPPEEVGQRIAQAL